MGIIKKRVNEFPTPYTCANAVKKGGLETKLSMVLMGLGNMVHGQIAKGLIYMAVEAGAWPVVGGRSARAVVWKRTALVRGTGPEGAGTARTARAACSA